MSEDARVLTNRAFDVLIADMRRLQQEAEENGLPDPFVQRGAKMRLAGSASMPILRWCSTSC